MAESVLKTMPDVNYCSYADRSNLVLNGLTVDPLFEVPDPAAFSDPQITKASSYDDLLKFSHCKGVIVTDFSVTNGGTQRENAIDCNRECSDLRFINGKLVAGRQNAFTAKGGCSNILVKNVQILEAGGHCDVELGNHSDQSRKKTTGVTLENVWRTDGKPVRVRVGNADWPRVSGGNIKILYAQSYLLKAYLFLRYLVS